LLLYLSARPIAACSSACLADRGLLLSAWSIAAGASAPCGPHIT
jgi:hypothetical protein